MISPNEQVLGNMQPIAPTSSPTFSMLLLAAGIFSCLADLFQCFLLRILSACLSSQKELATILSLHFLAEWVKQSPTDKLNAFLCVSLGQGPPIMVDLVVWEDSNQQEEPIISQDP